MLIIYYMLYNCLLFAGLLVPYTWLVMWWILVVPYPDAL